MSTIVISIILIIIVTLIIISMIKRRRSGKTTCSCGCSECPSSSFCSQKGHENDKPQNNIQK